MKILKLIIFLSIIFASCSSSKKKEKVEKVIEKVGEVIEKTDEAIVKADEVIDNGVLFFTINNQAIILINGEEVYDSGYVPGDKPLNLYVNLNPFLESGSNDVEIKLYNPDDGNAYDNPWEIVFEIYENAELVDYWFETSKNLGFKTGYVLTKEYKISID